MSYKLHVFKSCLCSLLQAASCLWVEFWTLQKQEYKTLHLHHLHFTAHVNSFHVWYLFFGPNGGCVDTSGRGTLFLYTAVNKMLISFYILGVLILQFVLLLLFIYVTLKQRTKSTWVQSLNEHFIYTALQCKIETLFMEILTKRPFYTEQFFLNSTLGLFTSLQCIQNTLGSGLFTNKDKYGRFWSLSEVGGRGWGWPVNQNSTFDLWPFVCVRLRT